MTAGIKKQVFRGWVLLTVASVVVVVFSGAAFAYFRSTGGGTGKGATGSPVSVTVNAASASNDLFPGHTGTVKFTLNNTNAFTANFTSVTAGSVTSGNQTNCPAANVTVAALPYSISTISVASGQTTATETIAGLISMSSSAPSLCQGVSFSVTLTLSGQSS